VNAGAERISIFQSCWGLPFDEVDGDACWLLNAPTYLFIETIAMILKIVIVVVLTSAF